MMASNFNTLRAPLFGDPAVPAHMRDADAVADKLRAALAPLFADPAVPACMRDAKVVADAAARCLSVADPDLAHAAPALRAVAGLPGELRVPGALLFMSSAGEFWRTAPSVAVADPVEVWRPTRSVRCAVPTNYPAWLAAACSETAEIEPLPAPVDATGTLADLGQPTRRMHLAAALERFAWQAAACALSGRDAEGPEARRRFWEEAGRLAHEPAVGEVNDLPHWLQPSRPTPPVPGAEEAAQENWRSRADRLAKPEALPGFQSCAGNVLAMCFHDHIGVPERHLAALAGVWRVTGLPYAAACGAIWDPALSLAFLRGCMRVPPSLRVPYYATLLAAHAASGRAAAFYADAVRRGHGNGDVPRAVVAAYNRDGEVEVEALKNGYAERIRGTFYRHRPDQWAAVRFDADLDADVMTLAARHFERDGTAKDPAFFARRCVEEATAFPAVTDLGELGTGGLAALIRCALSVGGWTNIPAEDCLVAARAAELRLGRNAGLFAGYLAELAASDRQHVPLGTHLAHALDEDGRAERLVADVRAAAGGTPALHAGALNAVRLAVQIADAHRQIRTRARGMLGPEGRRLAMSAEPITADAGRGTTAADAESR
jgi:hypothetical protein